MGFLCKSFILVGYKNSKMNKDASPIKQQMLFNTEVSLKSHPPSLMLMGWSGRLQQGVNLTQLPRGDGGYGHHEIFAALSLTLKWQHSNQFYELALIRRIQREGRLIRDRVDPSRSSTQSVALCPTPL